MPLGNALIRLRPMPLRVAMAPTDLLHKWCAVPQTGEYICGMCSERSMTPHDGECKVRANG